MNKTKFVSFHSVSLFFLLAGSQAISRKLWQQANGRTAMFMLLL